VKLYFVDGIEESEVKQPEVKTEVNERLWESLDQLIDKSQQQSSLESSRRPQKKDFSRVKTFTYFLAEWQDLRRRGVLAKGDSYERVSLLSGALFKDCEEGVGVLEELQCPTG
jgi:hypothetical protein